MSGQMSKGRPAGRGIGAVATAVSKRPCTDIWSGVLLDPSLLRRHDPFEIAEGLTGRGLYVGINP